ncbi:MAG: VOC family protein [bacterium]|nr:VOC family protein [bacterium]
MKLDHIVVAVGYDLEAAMKAYRMVGFTVAYGGVHASGATHNALIWFPGGVFIELMALTGNDPKPGAVDYTPLVRDRAGLVGYALRSDDLVMDVDTLRANGQQVDEPIESGRLRPDGLRLAWRNALVNGGYTPFLIEYLSPDDALRVPQDPLVTTHRNGVRALCRVEYAHGTVIVAAPADLTLDAAQTYGVIYQPEPGCG